MVPSSEIKSTKDPRQYEKMCFFNTVIISAIHLY